MPSHGLSKLHAVQTLREDCFEASTLSALSQWLQRTILTSPNLQSLSLGVTSLPQVAALPVPNSTMPYCPQAYCMVSEMYLHACNVQALCIQAADAAYCG